MPKDTYYFSHDYNCRNDDKIKLLLRKFGFTGYGLYWAIIEDLYNNANALRTDYEGIAFDLRTDKKIIESIINDFYLFEVEDGMFGSLSIQRRLQERNEKSKKARESAIVRWGQNKKDANALKKDANALRTECEGNAINKGKETKETKEIKENKESIFTPPLLQNVIEYFNENGYSENTAKKAYQFYDSANWKDSNGKKVKNWKQKMIGVWFKPENKINEESKQTKNVTFYTAQGKFTAVKTLEDIEKMKLNTYFTITNID